MILLDQVPLLAESTRAVDALADLLLRPRAHRGLVVDGHLEGLLSIMDLARALQARRPPRPSTPLIVSFDAPPSRLRVNVGRGQGADQGLRRVRWADEMNSLGLTQPA